MAAKNEDFWDKIKRLAEKTENIIEDQVEKLKKSGALDKIDHYAEKTGDYIGEKIDQFNQSDIPDKIDDFAEKTAKKTREAGDKISEKVENWVDSLKTGKNQKEGNPPAAETDKPNPIKGNQAD